MTPLRTIVYVSSAVQAFSVPELEALLLQARALNLLAGITGVLLHNDGNFMQCFEGPEDAVAKTYQRIKANRRHGNLMELFSESLPQRYFEGWEMGLAEPTASKLLALSTAQWTLQAGSAAEPGTPPGLRLLERFWRSARRY